MKTFKIGSLILITALSLSVLIFTFDAVSKSNNAASDLIWKQSVQQQLKEQTEAYQSEIYGRYSRIERDLNSYQYRTNKRIEHLEDRLSENGIIINNTNNQSNIN